MRYAEQLARGRDNNFNLLRALAAGAVIVSHSTTLVMGVNAPQVLESVLPFELGTAAVLVFFAISGFFIMKSFDRRRSLVEFWVARVLRIYPALLIVAVVTAFLIGPLFTLLSTERYFSIRQTWGYVPRALSLVWTGYQLPGLFSNSQLRHVNGSLWTLYYEVICYLGLTAAGLLGLCTKKRMPIFLVAFLMFYAWAFTTHFEYGKFYARFTLPFVLGMTAYVYREWVPLHWGIMTGLGAGAAILAHFGFFAIAAWTFAISYGALFLGTINVPVLLSYNRLGDYSYGIYIYGWPLQQVTAQLIPGVTPIEMICVALPAATVLGVLSWRFVEKPALAHRDSITAWIQAAISGRGGS